MATLNIGDLVRCKNKHFHAYTGIYKIESITLNRETKVCFYGCGRQTVSGLSGSVYTVPVILCEEDIELVYES